MGLAKRISSHWTVARSGKKTKLAVAMREHDRDQWDTEVLFVGFDPYVLDSVEREWIADLDTVNTGYNITPGGAHWDPYA